MKLTVLKLTYGPVMKWTARRALVGRNRCRQGSEKGRFTRADVDRFLEQMWHNFYRLAPSVPRESTLSNRMNMMLACMSLSFFRALLAMGVERHYAIELFADVAWKVYEKWAVPPRFLARVLTRDPVKRMRICVNLFLRFPFNPPGYVYAHLPSHNGAAFDVRRCPVAEYFRANQAGDLCVGSWCNLDYALAEMWGGATRAGRDTGGGR